MTPAWQIDRLSTHRRLTGYALIDGKPSILYGLTSVDCEHHCVSELHPVWVLAIHVKDDAADDVWAAIASRSRCRGTRARRRWTSTAPRSSSPPAAAGVSGRPPPAPLEWEVQGGEAEALVEELVARLPPERREALDRQLTAGPIPLDSVPGTR